MDIQFTSTVVAAIIGALASLSAIYLKEYFSNRNAVNNLKAIELKMINHEHFNHLRLYLAEVYYCLSDIQSKIKAEGGHCSALLYVDDARTISDHEDDWFINNGCFLISACYLTACLFYYMQKLRDDLPYLRLNNKDDSSLLSLMINVSDGFIKNLGVFYLIQSSIGADMYLVSEKRLLTYREFCLLLKKPSSRIWFDRLINFYIDTGRGSYPERISNLTNAINSLAQFIENLIGGNSSVDGMMNKDNFKSL